MLFSVNCKKINIILLILLLMCLTVNFVSAQSASLVKSISLNGSGSGPRMRMGDLNGDGRLDILMVQATSKKPSQVQMLTAIDGFTGRRLWQIGSDNGLTGTDRDEPAQIYDIDNDGALEVIAVMNNRMRIYNGANGTLEKEFGLPNSNAHDCIAFANFSGGPIASDMVLKDRYENA